MKEGPDDLELSIVDCSPSDELPISTIRNPISPMESYRLRIIGVLLDNQNQQGSHASTHGKDKYGRTIADVLLLDGTNVNHALNEGWCWWYRIRAA